MRCGMVEGVFDVDICETVTHGCILGRLHGKAVQPRAHAAGGGEMAGKPKCVRKEAGIVAVKWERNPKIEPDKE